MCANVDKQTMLCHRHHTHTQHAYVQVHMRACTPAHACAHVHTHLCTSADVHNISKSALQVWTCIPSSANHCSAPSHTHVRHVCVWHIATHRCVTVCSTIMQLLLRTTITVIICRVWSPIVYLSSWKNRVNSVGIKFCVCDENEFRPSRLMHCSAKIIMSWHFVSWHTTLHYTYHIILNKIHFIALHEQVLPRRDLHL